MHEHYAHLGALLHHSHACALKQRFRKSMYLIYTYSLFPCTCTLENVKQEEMSAHSSLETICLLWSHSVLNKSPVPKVSYSYCLHYVCILNNM